jgi:hypothetical protein
VLVTGGYIRPRWQVTDKITLQGNIEYNVWEYRGSPVASGENLKNRVRTFGGSVLWRPYQKDLAAGGRQPRGPHQQHGARRLRRRRGLRRGAYRVLTTPWSFWTSPASRLLPMGVTLGP